ncbi:hypothetical protein CDD83_4011 [Cordyceps sp. RAO-2017]|nr:hypothetical protein CDD83_4011 [Cordyceps sp. RAO-2017]
MYQPPHVSSRQPLPSTQPPPTCLIGRNDTIDAKLNVHVRDKDADADIDDLAFWLDSLRRLEEQYGNTVALEIAQDSVLASMLTLTVEGKHVLEQDELSLVGRDDVRWRGNGVEPDLGDQSAYVAVSEFSKLPPPTTDEPQVCMPDTPPKSVMALSDSDCSLVHRGKGWTYLAMKELLLAGPEGQRVLDNDELRIDQSVNVTYRFCEQLMTRGHKIVYLGNKSTPPDLGDRAHWYAKVDYFRHEAKRFDKLREAKKSVYVIMRDLERCGPAGQRVLNDHGLYIASPFEVRYRQTKGVSPDLYDVHYWNQTYSKFKRTLDDIKLSTQRTATGSKRPRVDEDALSTAADGGGGKRQRLSGTTLRRSPTASNLGTAGGRPVRRRSLDRHARAQESADTADPRSSNDRGPIKRERSSRNARRPGSRAVEALVPPPPPPPPPTRRRRDNWAQPQRRSSTRLGDGNTARVNKNRCASPSRLPPAKPIRVPESGGFKQRLVRAQDALARSTRGEMTARRSRRLAGYKPEYDYNGRLR